jgi:hypothetical protein
MGWLVQASPISHRTCRRSSEGGQDRTKRPHPEIYSLVDRINIEAHESDEHSPESPR